MMLVTLVICLFAFSSILGNQAYADGNLTYLWVSVPLVLALAGCCLVELPAVWRIAGGR